MNEDFLIQLATSEDCADKSLTPLDTYIATGKDYADGYDLITQGIGPSIPQGSLFAYLFRRFGFPNIASDPYKDLAGYLLTTAHPDMLLRITPYAGGDTNIGFSFLVPRELCRRVSNYPNRKRMAHAENFPNWIEANAVPPEWLDAFRRQAASEGYSAQDTPVATMQQTILALDMLRWSVERKNEQDSRVDWLSDMRAQYEAEYPEPEFEYRAADCAEWPDEDPMKDLAAAIAETLRQLKVPTWVRDVPIDPWGLMEEEDAIIREEELGVTVKTNDQMVAPSAGYPIGTFANCEPQAHAQLLHLVSKLGQGDITSGFAKANALLEAAAASGPSK